MPNLRSATAVSSHYLYLPRMGSTRASQRGAYITSQLAGRILIMIQFNHTDILG